MRDLDQRWLYIKPERWSSTGAMLRQHLVRAGSAVVLTQ